MKMHFVAQIKHNCNDYEGFVVVLNYLQEVGIMNLHILEHIASEKNMDVMRSIEFFIAMAVVTCVVGFVFLAAV
jgi:hypothetical protein